MKGPIKHKSKSKEQKNSSPVCFQNDPDIQEDYLLPIQKREQLPDTSVKAPKMKS
ncbi:hypothetical protein [uncultured Cyclobacterium sp.]|uniref:hypothetical protein n=1 Tax=uncultured Cyclobacterium sp. TaxID=453820 RepID=UPI0030EFA411|tara:strand:- start:562823 stop:562987 length:165 start_codon:yes stop_codon:yes gene_type:complete